jgi:hypothetical protein
MLVLMVPVFMGVLVDMRAGLMLVVVPVMAVGTALVAMLMLMLVLAVATHLGLTSLYLLIAQNISSNLLAVKGDAATQ